MKKLSLLMAVGVLATAAAVPPPAPKPVPNPDLIRAAALQKQIQKQLADQLIQQKMVEALKQHERAVRIIGRRPMPDTPVRLVPLGQRRNVEAIYLLNGDVLTGKFIGFDPDKGLVWQHPNIKPDLRVDLAKIARVTFVRKKSTGERRQNCRVRLVNGDELSGELSELNAQQLVLKTWYGGELTLARNAVQMLMPGETAMKTIFEGPDNKDGWVFSNANQRAKAQWVFKDGAFETTSNYAQVGRNFALPDKANIEFDIEWTRSMSLYINLYSDTLNNSNQGNFYSLRLTQFSAYLYKYESGPNFRRAGRVGRNTTRYTLNNPAGAARHAHVSIRVNKPKKIITLVINDQQVAEWTDNAASFAGKGQGILFCAHSAASMRLSGIRISQWDGRLPGKVDVTGGNAKEDFVRLANEDELSGALLGIKDGQMKFKTSFAKAIPIPLNKVSAIKLAVSAAPPPKAAPQAVRLTLKHRGQLTAALKEWKDGKVRLASPTLGEATIDASVIEAIEFNLDKNKVALNGPAPSTVTTGRTININGQMMPMEILGQFRDIDGDGDMDLLFLDAEIEFKRAIPKDLIIPRRR